MSHNLFIKMFKVLLLLRKTIILSAMVGIGMLFFNIVIDLMVLIYFGMGIIMISLFYTLNGILNFKLQKLEFNFISDVYEEIQVEKNIKNNFLHFTVVIRCWVYVLLGQFDEAVIVLDKFEVKNKKMLVSKYSIQFWIYAVTYNEEKFRQTEENFIALKNYGKYHDVVQYMNMLNCLFFTKKTTEIIQLSNSKLSIISQPFYSGLNYYNQQKFEQAKECFEQIKNERSDLYYVQEARKYLAQLNNG